MRTRFFLPCLMVLVTLGACKDKAPDCNSFKVSLEVLNAPVEIGKEIKMGVKTENLPDGTTLYLRDSLENSVMLSGTHDFVLPAPADFTPNYYYLVAQTDDCGELESGRVNAWPVVAPFKCSVAKDKLETGLDAFGGANMFHPDNSTLWNFSFDGTNSYLQVDMGRTSISEGQYLVKNKAGGNNVGLVFHYETANFNANYTANNVQSVNSVLNIINDGGLRFSACEVKLTKQSGSGPSDIVLSFDLK